MHRPESNSESISALVDGELEPQAQSSLVDARVADPDLRRQYENSVRIGDVLRGTHDPDLPRDFAAGVRSQIESEPTVLAPRRTAAISGFGARTRVVSFALAASAVLAAVLVLVLPGQEEPASPLATAPGNAVSAPATPMPAVAYAAIDADTFAASPDERMHVLRVARQPGGTVRKASMRWNADGVVEKRLNGYLLNHNEYLSSSVRGMLPYARIVGYETTARTANQFQ